jgi:hypothetical protein
VARAAVTSRILTSTVEIQAVDSQRSREAYERIWATLDDESIPSRSIWGQLLPYEPSRYRYVYGARRDRCL